MIKNTLNQNETLSLLNILSGAFINLNPSTIKHRPAILISILVNSWTVIFAHLDKWSAPDAIYETITIGAITSSIPSFTNLNPASIHRIIIWYKTKHPTTTNAKPLIWYIGSPFSHSLSGFIFVRRSYWGFPPKNDTYGSYSGLASRSLSA